MRNCKAHKLNTKSKRQIGGSALTETAPAIFILFIIILFPLIDLMYMAFAYSIVWYLNHLEVRELAVREPIETSQALTEIDTQFLGVGLAKFVGLTPGQIQHPLPNKAVRSGTPETVTLTTQARVMPFLSLPFIMPVAGINQPVIFTVTSNRLQEEQGKN
ncbi:MAG: hypothetical protein KIT34_09530 [Cyanobacteria bacterium TGS_CYA1]|nr:hypothetical protein [Cyanobacteria bacterium TGS_CYA1]